MEAPKCVNLLEVKMGGLPNGQMRVERRGGNLQNTADRLDPTNLSMLFDDSSHFQNGQLSFA
jgi:hypothetical protein